jgi:hypothetical protein
MRRWAIKHPLKLDKTGNSLPLNFSNIEIMPVKGGEAGTFGSKPLTGATRQNAVIGSIRPDLGLNGLIE